MIYSRIKEICDSKGISIRSLEQKAGLGNGVISAWDECSPRASSILAVAKALEVPVEQLLEEGGE